MKTKTLILLSLFGFRTQVMTQYSCATAVNLTNGYTSGIISTPGTSTSSTESWVSSVSTDGNTSATGFTYPDVYTFKYTTGAVAGESFYFTIECDYAVDGEHSIGVWTGCSGSSLSSCLVSTYKFKNVVGVCAQNLSANTTYYVGVGKEWASSANTASGIASRKLKFKVLDFTVETSATIPSNECNTAAAINIADPYAGSTRCNYSASAASPPVCGMSIENDSWMKFTAGSTEVVIDYEVYNCTNGYGVQLAIFSGTCGSLSLISGSCVNYASNNAGGTWTLSGLTVNQTYYIRTDGYAGDLCSYSFNPVSGVVIMPIELIDFKAEALSSGYNRITWTTASETNSAYFELEKSLDGKIFMAVSKTNAQGNSLQINNYYVLDKNETNQVTYYRLKNVDLNGTFHHSGIISVKNEVTSDLSLYPNPTKNGKFNIKLNAKSEQQQIDILDQQGRVVITYDNLVDNEVHINLEQQQKGIYFVKLSINDEVKTYKLINQ